MIRQYPALIHKDKDSDYGVSFPDLPGCVSAGKTPEEAHRLAEEALQFHLDGMLEDEDPIPEPSSLNDIYPLVKKKRAVVATLIEVRVPSVAKRINVTVDETLLDKIDEAAERRHMSRSAFLAEGARCLMNSE